MSSFPGTLYRRLTASVPLLITLGVHVVLVAVAGYFVTESVISKKKLFEAAAESQPSIAQKQVEHRLQVARKSSGSASTSPVSASRIFSTAENALQMPEMPALPSVGASSLSGMGFGAGMGAMGTGTGYNTSVGPGGGLGSGFMSMSFLGMTNQRVSKVVFVVDVGRDLLDIRKGGFEAFKIIREEIMRLISQLPPSAEFNVVLYERGSWNNRSVAAFSAGLNPATVTNKNDFFTWLDPVNKTPDKIGQASVVGNRVNWTPKDLTSAGVDGSLDLPDWVEALRFALEMEPDTVFVISGSQGAVRRQASEAEIARRKRENESKLAELRSQGLDPAAVSAARGRALAKARAELDAINVKLRAQGKSPLIITNANRIFEADFQTALKRAGFSITLDKTGWTDKKGELIWTDGGISTNEAVDFDEVVRHVSKLQLALLRKRATINYFLFVGPDEKTERPAENLGKVTSRNGGRFELLTTKRLREISAEADKKK